MRVRLGLAVALLLAGLSTPAPAQETVGEYTASIVYGWDFGDGLPCDGCHEGYELYVDYAVGTEGVSKIVCWAEAYVDGTLTYEDSAGWGGCDGGLGNGPARVYRDLVVGRVALRIFLTASDGTCRIAMFDGAWVPNSLPPVTYASSAGAVHLVDATC